MPWSGGTHIARSRLVVPYVRRFEGLAAGIFRQQADAFLREAQDAQDHDALLRASEIAARTQHEAWRAWTRRNLATTGAAFARAGLPAKRGQRDAWGADPAWWSGVFRPRLGSEAWWDVWLEETLRYADRVAGERIRDLDAATSLAVRRLLTGSLAAGEGVATARDRLDELFRSSYTSVRATRIARTEVLTAARAGGYHAILAVGLQHQVTKSWQDSGDVLVRDTHAEATQENQGLDYQALFRVRSPSTGETQLLLFPGDSSLGADASNVVNCRCDQTTQLT